jgi:hypothetical protein
MIEGVGLHLTEGTKGMEKVLFLLADYANVSKEGKLNVMGIFDRLNATGFPTRHPEMHLVVKLRGELGEWGGSRQLTIRLIDQDGKEISSISRSFVVPEAKAGRPPEVNFIIGLRDMVFPEPGIYEFVLLVDGERKGGVPIYVNQIEPPEETEPPEE